MPRMPFSDWIQTCWPGGRNEGARVGIPGKESRQRTFLISLRLYLVKTKKSLTDTEVDVEAGLQLPRRPPRDPIPLRLRIRIGRLRIPAAAAAATDLGPRLKDLDLRLLSRGYDAVDKDARKVDVVGVNLADLDDVLSLDDGHLCGLGHERRERLSRVPEDAVASLVRLPRPQDGDVAVQGCLHEVRSAAEYPRLPRLAVLDHVAVGVEPDGDCALLDERVYA